MSLLGFPALLVILSTFWTGAAAVRSSTLHLARSHTVSPNAGAPLAAWAASLAAQSAADAARVVMLAAGPAKPKNKGNSFVPIAPGRQILSIPNYVARAHLGTPSQTLLVAIDPSNDAAWVPCSACIGCAAAPSFSPTQSSTFQPVRCGSLQCAQVPNPSCPGGAGSSCAFNLTYAASTFQAMLGQDSVALENAVVASYTFGCLRVVTGSSVPPQGLIGFGRGPLSFLSQTRDIYGSIFSYCLPSYKSSNFSGTLKLGPIGQPKKIKTTPLLYNPRRPSLYYVNMIGIRVGGKAVQVPASALAFDPITGTGTIIDAGTMYTRLAAPVYAAVRDAFRRRVHAPVAAPLGGFDTCYSANASVVSVPASALAFNPATGSGTIIDAGTMYTRLAAPVYAAVRDAFRLRVHAPVVATLGGFDTCFNVNASVVSVPTITFMFAGPVTMTLPEENVMIHSSSGGIACLAMAAGPTDGVNAALNVLASMQQQNHRVLFDVANGRVGFSRELCTA